MIKITTNEKSSNKDSGIVYVQTEQIEIDGQVTDYDFVFNEIKLVKLTRALRVEHGIQSIEALNGMDKNDMIKHIGIFDTLVDAIVDDKRMNDLLKNGLGVEGIGAFFQLFADGLTALTKKLEWKTKNKKNIPRKDGHRSTTGKPKQK